MLTSKRFGMHRIFVDSAVLACGLIYFSSRYNADLQNLSDLFRAPSFYFIIFCDVVIAFIFGFSTSVFNHQRINMLAISVFRFLLDLSIIQLFNFIFLKDRLGVFSPEVLILTMVLTCLFSVAWRLFYFESLYANKKFKIYVSDEFAPVVQKDLREFKGHREFLSNDKITNLAIQDNFTYVVQETDLKKAELNFLMQLKINGVEIFTIRQFYEQVLRKIPIEQVSLKDLVIESGFELTSRLLLQRAKRVSDVLLALILFVLTWPLILVFGFLHKIESAGPIFYTQTRTGKFGRHFTIYKLRSMHSNAEVGRAVWASKDDARITRIGKLIRLTRIDELPQLWNVIRGDMSFIGPRPERPEFNLALSEQIPFYDLRHTVRPGLTGWAQVRFPYGASAEDAKEKLQYDLFYIKNYSLLLDIEILIKTVQVVVFGMGR